MMEKVHIPQVAVLHAFTFEPGSWKEDRLRYPSGLTEEATKIFYEMDRLSLKKKAKDAGDHIEESLQEQELLKTYLVELARQGNSAACPLEQQHLMDAFTEISCKLHGSPDESLARDLAASQAGQMFTQTNNPATAYRYKGAASRVGITIEHPGVSNDPFETAFGFERSQSELGNYLRTRYADVYEAMNMEAKEVFFTPEDIVNTFQVGIDKLSESEPAWKEWKVERQQGKSALSVWHSAKRINVGIDRSPTDPKRLYGLFAHEVLRHALTAVNGAKIDAGLSRGLPGYGDFEEGTGMFHEYALTGTLRDELIDRYTDIAIALGYMNDGKKVPRSALLEYALAREEIRNETRAGHDVLSSHALQKKVYTHVNRIYRGTPGTDAAVGVHTRDISYLQGFLIAGAYIESELTEGKTIEAVMEYITQGKFDPTKPEHAEYVAQLHRPKATSVPAPIPARTF